MTQAQPSGIMCHISVPYHIRRTVRPVAQAVERRTPGTVPRLYKEPGFEALRRSIYYSLLTGMVYGRGNDLSQLKSVSAINNFL